MIDVSLLAEAVEETEAAVVPLPAWDEVLIDDVLVVDNMVLRVDVDREELVMTAWVVLLVEACPEALELEVPLLPMP